MLHPQVEVNKGSAKQLLFKLSLVTVAGGTALYYIQAHHPNTIPALLSKFRPQVV